MYPPEDNPPPPDEPQAPILFPKSGSSLDDTERESTEDDAEDAAQDDDEVRDWKDQMRTEFEAWLETVDAIPDLDADDQDAPDAPDLYSFYAQWAAANAEARKGNRRTAEAFSQWGDTLARFDGDLKLLREQWQRLSTATATEGLSRPHCLVLVELLDRMRRVATAFESTPQRPWWGGDGAWRQAWENQRQAFDILCGHFEGLLRKEGVTRLEALGQIFDPATMTAVAAESDPNRSAQTVLEELAPGYRLRGELLRPAQVKVNQASKATP